MITKISGHDGTFTGECNVLVPFFNFARVPHQFNNIKVNELNQMYEGKLVSIYNPNSIFVARIGDGKNKEGENQQENLMGEKDTIVVETIVSVNKTFDGTILVISGNGDTTSIHRNTDGSASVIHANGDTTKMAAGDPVVIADSNGKTAVIDKDGNISNVGNPEDVLVSTSNENAKKLKFIINNKEYTDNDPYYTIYNNKDLEVRIEKADTSAKIDLTKIMWKLAGKETPSKDKLPNILTFKINPINLPTFSNDLLVLDNLGKALIKMKIKTYYAPIVKFEEGSGFKGEYFFDRGYELMTNLAKPEYYDTIHVGKKKETYYASVIGLNKGQMATIKVNLSDFTNNASQDKDFRIVFKPEITGKIKINGLDSLILDATGLDNLNDIIITAKDFINGNSISAMSIDVNIKSTREKVGMLKYYCAEKVIKTVDLIYTKFIDESACPSYLTDNSLKQYMDNNSMNQLFLDFKVNPIQFASLKYKSTDMNSWTTTQIIDSLNIENFGVKKPVGYTSKEYFYITNLDIPRTGVDIFLGGFHWPGNAGGVQVKYRATSYNESAEEQTIHEFGHWLGLPHTFESFTYKSNNAGSLIIESTQGGTKNNFMDYKVHRTKWLKIQLINYTR